MITYLYSSLFDSPAQTLVNTVNTVGVMGKGVAKVFRDSYPEMYVEYKNICRQQKLGIGNLHLWKSAERWILNLPTKTTWRKPSEFAYIEAGLQSFVTNYRDMGISSVSFPPLGCGNGGLPWDEVRPIMERYLKCINIPVYIHNIQVPDSFVAEHLTSDAFPANFNKFWTDIKSAITENGGCFATIEAKKDFKVKIAPDNCLHVMHASGKGELLDFEEIENAWVAMRDGILSIDRYSDEKSRRYKSYLFPVLASLPYVRMVPIAKVGNETRPKSSGLFFRQRRGSTGLPDAEAQGCLSL